MVGLWMTTIYFNLNLLQHYKWHRGYQMFPYLVQVVISDNELTFQVRNKAILRTYDGVTDSQKRKYSGSITEN